MEGRSRGVEGARGARDAPGGSGRLAALVSRGSGTRASTGSAGCAGCAPRIGEAAAAAGRGLAFWWTRACGICFAAARGASLGESPLPATTTVGDASATAARVASVIFCARSCAEGFGAEGCTATAPETWLHVAAWIRSARLTASRPSARARPGAAAQASAAAAPTARRATALGPLRVRTKPRCPARLATDTRRSAGLDPPTWRFTTPSTGRRDRGGRAGSPRRRRRRGCRRRACASRSTGTP
jgi:hypothetical protein